MSDAHGPRPLLVKVVIALFCVALVGAMIVLPFRSLPTAWLWTQAPFVVLAGTTTALLLIEREGTGDGVRLLLVLFFGSALLVGFAAGAGTPFGRVRFTANLGPRVAGVLPLGVPFLWLGVVGGSLAAARSLLGAPRSRVGWSEALRVAAVAATLTTLVSLSLDPVGRVLRLWWWHAPGRFDGVPLPSVVGWWTTSLVLALAAFTLAPRLRILRRAPSGPILVLLALQGLLLAVALRSERVVAVLAATTTSVLLVHAFQRARWPRVTVEPTPRNEAAAERQAPEPGSPMPPPDAPGSAREEPAP